MTWIRWEVLLNYSINKIKIHFTTQSNQTIVSFASASAPTSVVHTRVPVARRKAAMPVSAVRDGCTRLVSRVHATPF